MKQRIWFVIGMAFFWPFIKGPYLARFLDEAGQSPFALLVAVAMLAAFLVLSCAWMSATLRQASRESDKAQSSKTLFLLVLSYLASFVVEIPIDFADGTAAKSASLLFPLLSGLAFWRLSQVAKKEDSESSCETGGLNDSRRRAPWHLAALVALIYAASGVLSGMYSSTPVQGSLLSACLAVPLVACAWASRRATSSALLWGFALVPLIMSSLCVIVPTPGIFSVGLSVLTAGRRGVFMLLWPVLAKCALACHDKALAARLCALCYAAVYLLVRTLIDALRTGGVEHVLPAVELQATTLAVALVIVACALGVITLVARSHEETADGRSLRLEAAGRQTVSSSIQAVSPADEPVVTAPSERDLRHTACMEIAQETGLTEMEELALEFVSMGYTVARIAQERGVTENTVRTHTKGLYRKLDVHSKQEVIELVERRMGK